jgi:Cu(I)/Ag(I) efflux system membrane fusion protein
MKMILQNKILQFSLVALGGLLIGWLLFHQSSSEKKAVKEVKKEIWTCSMDPQVKQDHPGACPICGMDLIPLVTGGGSTMDSTALYLTPEAIQLANIATTVVSRQHPVKELRLYGKVQADERLVQSQTAAIPGRIERLFVGFTGETVRKGQLLALLNSPELIAAQQELLETAKIRADQPDLYEAAKARLRQWKLSDKQIGQIVSSGKVKTQFEVLSGSSGIVTAKRVNTGDYVSAGSVLFEVADLSRVWVLFDAYESDLPFLKTGDKIAFSFQALPGKNFQSSIRFIDPVLDPTNRVSRLRVEVDNAGGKLKPEMFATGLVKASLNAHGDQLVIPASAVLWTGKRSVVYVKLSDGAFKLREVELGPELAGSYAVTSGLDEGEEIVTEGAFSVDAASQLEGKASMML